MLCSISFQNLQHLAWILPLAALPLIVHLLNRKRPPVLAFPSVTMIRLAEAASTRLFRLRHLILLLLRTAAALLLIAAVLRPLMSSYGKPKDLKQRRNALIILDHSHSMSSQNEGLAPRDRALIELESILGQLKSDDRAGLIAAGAEPKLAFDELSTRHSDLLRFARDLPPSYSRCHVVAALNQAKRLAASLHEPCDIFVISDFQRSDWAAAQLDRNDPLIRFILVPVGPKQSDNHAVTSIRCASSRLVAGQSAPLDIRVANHGPQSFSSTLRIQAGQENLSLQVELAPWSSRTLRAQIPLRQAGLMAVSASLPKDDLPGDDSFHGILQVSDREEVVLITDEGDSLPSPGFFLKAAIDPFEQERGGFRVSVCDSRNLNSATLARTQRIILSGLAPLGDKQMRILSEALQRGAGILWFLDGENDGANLDAFAKTLPGSLPVLSGPRLDARNLPGGRLQLLQGDFRSPWLAPFESMKSRATLSAISFHELLGLRASGTGKVLLSFSDGTPAIAIAPAGLGRIVIANFSARETSSDIASRQIFPGWMQQLCARLGPDTSPVLSAAAGNEISKDFWSADLKGARLVDPSNKSRSVENGGGQEQRHRFAFRPESPGLWKLDKSDGKNLYTWAVSCPENEADLRPIPLTSIPGYAKGGAVTAQGAAAYKELNQGLPAAHFFLLAALLLLVSELLLPFLLARRRHAAQS
ncbi:MAG: hypothetical protein RL095_3086 [Verrucomicrobiota bacterium]|jgi:hypothetical protein